MAVPRIGHDDDTVVYKQEPWSCRFHASTGRTYVLRLVAIVTSGADDPMRPVALVEDVEGRLAAHYPDPRVTRSFPSIEDAATFHMSFVSSFEGAEPS